MKNLARAQPKSTRQSQPTDRRRSQRVPTTKRVEVSWHARDGSFVSEPAETRNISSHGTLLVMEHGFHFHEVVSLRCGAEDDWLLARVMRCGPRTPDGRMLVGVELAVPDDVLLGAA